MGEGEVVPVAIVGAGLAGLGMAVGLHERRIPFKVFEKSSTLRNSSSTVFALFKNGSTALEGIRPGLSSLMRSAGIAIDSATLITYEECGEPTSSHRCPPDLCMIPWAAAQKLLASLIPSDHIVFGHKLIAYEAVEGGAKAVFEVSENKDSSIVAKSVHTELLIGADGLWSATRETLVGDQPRYTHQVFWNAVTSGLNDMFKKHRTGQIVFTRNKAETARAFMLGSEAGYCFWNIRTLDPNSDLSRKVDASYRSGDISSHKVHALEAIDLLGGWKNFRTIVEDTDPEIISERKLMDRVPLMSWSGADGHVLLIGDAAHAMHYGPGQGAMSSFEDAHQLSNLLDAALGSSNTLTIPDAVLKFEGLRIPRLKKIQIFSAESSGFIGLKPSWTLELSEEERKTRSEEFSKWVTAYPDKMDGDPDSQYWR